MAFPDAAKNRVLREPRVRSEWTTLKAATIKECVVTALDKRESNPPHASFRLYGHRDSGDTRARSLEERTVTPLPFLATGYQERHHPPVTLVGSAVRRPQPVLLVHGTKDNVEGYKSREDGTVRRHSR